MRKTTSLGLLAAGFAALLLVRPDSAELPAGAEYDEPVPHGQSGVVVFDLEDGASADEVADFAARHGLTLEYSSEWSRDEALLRGHVDDIDAVLAEVAGDPLLEVAEPVVEFAMYGFPNDPMWDKQWNMVKIGAPTGWRAGAGAGVKVAVIDTGVTVVEDLQGVTVTSGRTFVPGTRTADDDHGHGTHVAGTIAQATNNGLGVTGVAATAEVVPYKVLSKQGYGSSDWVAAAVDAAVDDGVDVINMSLGGPNSKVLKTAVEKAVKAGVIVVAAAGNTGKRGVGCPANVEGVVAVSATGPDDAKTWYSTYGPEVAISAPGGDLRQGKDAGVLQDTIDGKGGHAYQSFQGTSMATPHVAGAAAVMLGMGLDADAAVDALLTHSVDLGDEGRDELYGYGRLDVAAAVKAVSIEQRGLMFLVGGLLAGALSWLARIRGSAGFMMTAAGALTAGGLFFLPLISGLPGGTVLDLLSRGLVSWPAVLLGADWVHFPLWLSALLPASLAFVFGPTRSLGPIVGGVCAGFAASLLHGAASGTLDPWWMSWGFDALWLSLNGTFCLLAGMAVAGMYNLRQRS
jgi:serine protease